MVNKKIIFLIFAGIFFVLLLNSFVGADWQQKVDWAGNAFEWCDVGTTSHNVEYCGYSYYGSDIYEYACDEDGNFNYNNCVDNTKCFQASAGSSYKIVYIPIPGSPPIWYSAKCKGASHNVGRHFANMFGGTDNDVGDYEYYQPYPKFATITCTDTDGDRVSRSGGACGQVESTACDRDSSTYGIYSPSTEISDGKDNDCDGQIDEGFCTTGQTTTTGCNQVGYCSGAQKTCSGGGIWGLCSKIPQTEVCTDNIDNDCDGQVNEGFFHDGDGDGFGKNACNPLEPAKVVGNSNDCNDDPTTGGANIYPGAPEKCDGVDNQCPQTQSSVDENPDSICPNPGEICYSPECKIPTTYWASDSNGANKITQPSSIKAGDVFYLVLEFRPKQVDKWLFEIWEDDGSPNANDKIRTKEESLEGTIQGNKLIATWTVTQEDINRAETHDDDQIYEFYFVVKGFEKIKGTFELGEGGGTAGKWERQEFGQPGEGTFYIQEPVIISGTWETTGGEGGISSGIWAGTTTISPIISYSGTWSATVWNLFVGGEKRGTWESNDGGLSGIWVGTTDEKEIVYQIQSSNLQLEDLTGGEQQPTPTCSTDSDCSQGQECTGGVCVTSTLPEDGIDCTQYLKCSDLNKNECEDEIITNTCNLGPQNVDCTDPNIDCGCSWSTSTSSCGSSFISTDINGNSLGTCNFQEGIPSKTCASDGVLEYLTTATWSGDPLIAEDNGCIGGTVGPIICSAKTKLPLESKFGILLTIITIIGIYFVFYRKNKILKKEKK